MNAQTNSTSSNPLKLLRIIWRVLFVILLGMSAILVGYMFRAAPQPSAPDRLPVHQTIPDFQLVKQTGQSCARQDLSGTNLGGQFCVYPLPWHLSVTVYTDVETTNKAGGDKPV